MGVAVVGVAVVGVAVAIICSVQVLFAISGQFLEAKWKSVVTKPVC